MSNLAIRFLTAGTLGPLVLVLLFWGPAWGWALLACLSAGQVAWELLSMTHARDRVSRFVGAAVTIGLAVATYVGARDPRVLLTALIGATLSMAFLTLARLGEMGTAALRLLGGVATPIYVGLTFACLALMRRDFAAEGHLYVFLTLTVAWMGDTGGYTFGRLFGKTKLYVAVSPKKTREGLLGSVIFSTLVAVIAALTYLPSLPVLHAALLGGVGGLFGQAGDLVESLLKRSMGVKDSGSVLPGHGGMFDRVDALLIVGAVVYLYGLWFR